MTVTIPYYPSITAFINDQNRIKKLGGNMTLQLKDLVPGEKFEYVETTRAYRLGKFLVLDSDKKGSYLESVAEEGCVFIFSFITNKICKHWGLLDVNLISDAKENNVENRMGHFTDWKFGVPVKIYEHNPGGYNYPQYDEARLVNENDKHFMIIFDSGVVGSRSKRNFHYELIPHKAGGLGPRYPVCSNSGHTAYCNSGGIMGCLDSFQVSNLQPYPTTATLTIDGKTIELSDETVAELRKKLGV